MHLCLNDVDVKSAVPLFRYKRHVPDNDVAVVLKHFAVEQRVDGVNSSIQRTIDDTVLQSLVIDVEWVPL